LFASCAQTAALVLANDNLHINEAIPACFQSNQTFEISFQLFSKCETGNHSRVSRKDVELFTIFFSLAFRLRPQNFIGREFMQIICFANGKSERGKNAMFKKILLNLHISFVACSFFPCTASKNGSKHLCNEIKMAFVKTGFFSFSPLFRNSI
jgi:hypothetical protein